MNSKDRAILMKPLTAPDRKAYEPYVKPKFVDDTSKPKSKKWFKPKTPKAKPLYQICEKCHNIISLTGECDFCGHTNTTPLYGSSSL